MQKLQNSAQRKILGFFCIVSINALKIELNISSIEICMHRKMQKYALRKIKMIENHSIRICISIFYFSKYQSELFDRNLIQWDDNEKKHVSQINQSLNIMTSHVNQIKIENTEIWIKSWKEIKHWFDLKIDRVENLSIENSSIENSSNKLEKKLKTKYRLKITQIC